MLCICGLRLSCLQPPPFWTVIFGNILRSSNTPFPKPLNVTGWTFAIEMNLNFTRGTALVAHPRLYIHNFLSWRRPTRSLSQAIAHNDLPKLKFTRTVALITTLRCHVSFKLQPHNPFTFTLGANLRSGQLGCVERRSGLLFGTPLVLRLGGALGTEPLDDNRFVA